MAQGVNEQIGILPAVEAEGHFVQVGLQMLGAEFVPRSHDAALEQRECRFYSVDVDVSSISDVFLGAVVHRFVLALKFTHSFRVGAEIIGHDHVNILRNVLLDVSRQSSALSIFRVKESQITVALANTNDAFLVISPAIHWRPRLTPPT